MAEESVLGLHNLPAPRGASRARKRKGRGPGSGVGKTAGRGHKGQRARAGGRVRPGFEGGQMPLIRRLPKRGFTSLSRETNQVVNLKHLDRVAGTDVTPDTLKAAGLVEHADAPIKVLAMGEATRAYAIRGCSVSAGARTKIEKAGGSIEE